MLFEKEDAEVATVKGIVAKEVIFYFMGGREISYKT